MPIATKLVAAFASAACTVGLLGTAQAVSLADGTVYFTSPPRLVGARTTQKSTYVWGATYYFTLRIPENAGEPLQRITIAQRESPDTLQFYPEQTRASEGERFDSGLTLPLGSVTTDKETRSVSITFDPPVAPGKTVTVGIRPKRNPDSGGVYLFGVTAFPAGDKAYGQFLGFGRLSFYESDGGLF